MSEIISLRYQNEIQNACTYLPQIGLRYFVMYILFNNGSKFVVSNIFHMLNSYYAESLYKEDYSIQPETIKSASHYLCDKTISVSNKFKNMLEERYNVYRAYYIVRKSPECTFVFGAIKNGNFDNSELIYKDTLTQFEDFCADFTEHFMHLIIHYNPHYRNSFIFTNPYYRRAIIKQGYPNKESLTDRERDCLILASKGKSTKEIAKILKLSPHTIETYAKKIKEKLNCSTMIEAVLEGMHRGIIGNINHWHQPLTPPKKRNIKIIANMDAAKNEIEKNSLTLFNSI